ncbi:MAG: NADP-dependent oxidoreductase [Bacteroidetes bacterium]|nr:NADP-dependent oxidoreductase [Bacteroidota bacterium]
MNKQILLKSRPVGKPTLENFDIVNAPAVVVEQGELLIKAKYLSVDPYMRGRMSDAKSYVAPFEVGKPIEGGVVGEVIESNHPDFKVGDKVIGALAWQEIQAIAAEKVTKLNPELAPLSYYLGILGMPGLTAYFGLLDIGKPTEGETVVVSGAAGAVGMVVGQIARLKGCRVVGIAGSDEKNSYLKNELHFDEVINYNATSDMDAAIANACPNGVDVYFDNVGGEISDAVVANINKGARIILCGQISLYNNTEAAIGPRLQPTLLKKSALMQGFIVSNYLQRWPEGVLQLAKWLSDGKLKYQQTITSGFENLPQAFIGLFEGKNTGKSLVEVI